MNRKILCLRCFASNQFQGFRSYLLISLFLLAVACDESDEASDTGTYCWECTTTTSVSPSIPGYPKTNKYSQCDLTSDQARTIESNGTYSSSVSGASASVKTTCRKK